MPESAEVSGLSVNVLGWEGVESGCLVVVQMEPGRFGNPRRLTGADRAASPAATPWNFRS